MYLHIKYQLQWIVYQNSSWLENLYSIILPKNVKIHEKKTYSESKCVFDKMTTLKYYLNKNLKSNNIIILLQYLMIDFEIWNNYLSVHLVSWCTTFKPSSYTYVSYFIFIYLFTVLSRRTQVRIKKAFSIENTFQSDLFRFS